MNRLCSAFILDIQKFSSRQTKTWLFTFQRIFNIKSWKKFFFLIGFFAPKWISCSCRMLYLEEILETSKHTQTPPSQFIDKEIIIRLFFLSQEQVFWRTGTMPSDFQPCRFVSWELQTHNWNKIWRYNDLKTIMLLNEICLLKNSTL